MLLLMMDVRVLYRLARVPLLPISLAGSRLGARSSRNSPWPYPSAVSVIERLRSVAALRADAEVFRINIAFCIASCSRAF